MIYKQQTQGKHIDFDGKTQGKMGGNHQNLRENDVENSVRTLLFSNHCLSLGPMHSMKLGTFVQWSFFVFPNNSARICLNIFADTVIQSLNSGLGPMSRLEKLADFSSYSLRDL